MSNTNTRAFCDMNGETIELTGICCAMEKPAFLAKFPGIKGVPYDGYSYRIMSPVGGPFRMADMLPVTRAINYKKRPSLHECSAKCMNGKCGGTCECKCGGKNHGLGRCA